MYYSLLGWAGTILIVSAFYANSTKRLESTSKVYLVMNLLGAIGVGTNVFVMEAWPAFTLQCVWGVIALVSLFKKQLPVVRQQEEQ